MERLRRLLRGSALAIALLLAASTVRAEDLRFGYIDSARIFLEYKDAQEAQQRFERQVQGWRDEAAEKEKGVQQLRQEVRDQGPILSALKRQEKEQALQRAISEYESFLQDIWGPQGRAAQENERATSDVIQQIRVEVEKIASERGLELVFDTASGFLIYADRKFDLTPEIIVALNERATSTGR